MKQKLTLPKRIQVGPIPYKVVLDQRAIIQFDSDEHTRVVALVNYGEQTMTIGDTQAREQVQESLVHESLHAMLHGLGFWEENNNEHFVQALANSVTDWIKRNKALVAYVQEK